RSIDCRNSQARTSMDRRLARTMGQFPLGNFRIAVQADRQFSYCYLWPAGGMRRRNDLSDRAVISTSGNGDFSPDGLETGFRLVPDNLVAHRRIWSNAPLSRMSSGGNLVCRPEQVVVVWRFLVHRADEPAERTIVACTAGRNSAGTKAEPRA